MIIRRDFKKTKIGQAWSKLKENPFILLPVIVVAVVLVFFWQAILVLALAAIIMLIIVKVIYQGPSLKDLTKRKRILFHEIEILEKNYMKRKMSKKNFLDSFRKKQMKLIALEARIDEKFNKEKLSEPDPQVMKVAAKKKHIVEKLLSQKKIVLKEMQISQKLYFKRKIDSATCQKIINEKQNRLIELEAQLKEIYGEQSVSKVITDLKKRLATVERQMYEKSEKVRKAKEDKEMNMAEQISEQLKDIK